MDKIRGNQRSMEIIRRDIPSGMDEHNLTKKNKAEKFARLLSRRKIFTHLLVGLHESYVLLPIHRREKEGVK